MRKYLLLYMLLYSSFLCAQNNTPGKPYQQPATPVCITHVNVVNVITQKTDADQTVVIENNRISAVGSTKKVKTPANAQVIDGTGKYLMPGMTDAHIHFFQSGGLYTRPDAVNLNSVYPYEKDQQWVKDNRADLMARYLACGITTVIDVGGPFSNYAIRSQLDTTILAPNAFVTGPLISTYLPPNLDKNDPPIIKVNSEQEARDLVKKQLPYKPDFIKIWYIVLRDQKPETTYPIVKAAIEESHANGLKVAVHATQYQTAKLAVEAGADILVHSVDDKPLDNEMLQLMKSRNIVYIPTLVVAEGYHRTFTQQFDFTAHDLTWSNPFMLGSLLDLQHLGTKAPFDYHTMRNRFHIPAKEDTIMATNLKLAQQAGVLIVSGTDAGNIGTQHAASYGDELLAMQKAGLSNWEIIRSATINAAKGFGKEKDLGSIEKGKLADLLLLDSDPTSSLPTPASIRSIFHHGAIIQPENLIQPSPEMLVQQQVNGYNIHNIDAFLAPYSDNVVIYDADGKVLMKGKQEIRGEYTKYFNKTPDLHCQIVNRMVMGNTVVDQEKLTSANRKPSEGIAVYKIDNGKIVTVHFIE
ncbi:amidohydrolase [Niastella koreensis]|uniref:Amidohydrolase n=2 Tax=Niastella koreensis TaxID=354356 RepID=G8TH01_NIAKG|nr:amidohydrolase family protein [Niastella koreensis]AEW00612.1 amidohydrolase [Niastella koreensis GR20-10]OQP42250.1 amidohydrolase [Niastella koreensis]